MPDAGPTLLLLSLVVVPWLLSRVLIRVGAPAAKLPAPLRDGGWVQRPHDRPFEIDGWLHDEVRTREVRPEPNRRRRGRAPRLCRTAS